MIPFSVTNLHICQRCPRLLAYIIHKNEPNAWRVGLKGNRVFPGKKFHQIAGTLHTDLCGNGDNGRREAFISALNSPEEEIDEKIRDFIRTNYFIPFIGTHGQEMNGDQISALAHGFEKWGDYLSNFLSPHLNGKKKGESLVHSVFHKAEAFLSSPYLFPDGEKLVVKGRPDALLFDPKRKNAVILEFKGRKISDVTEEVAQTSIYAWLVFQEVGILPRVEILYLEEEEPLVTISPEHIRYAIDNLPSLFDSARNVWNLSTPIPGNFALCTECPFSSKCEDDFGDKKTIPDRAISPQRTLSDLSSENENPEPVDEGDSDAQKYMHDLVRTLDLLKIPVTSEGYIYGPRFIRLKIKPDFGKGVTVNKISNKAYDLQVALGLPSPPLLQPQGGYISVDIPRIVREPLTLRLFLEKGENSAPVSDAAFPLGMGIDGSVFYVNLAEPTMTSILIGGTSGSGKSELLRSIIVGLALSAPKDTVTFTLIDPKRVTFTDFTSLPYLDGTVLMDADRVMNRLEDVVREMEARYRNFEEKKVHDIISYNAIVGDPYKRRVIVVDEYADLIINKETKEGLETAIQRIGQKGRAAGFHLILATQRPDAKVVTGIIKANLQLKICLKVTSAANSRIILDESGGEFLIGHGDMLVGGNIALQRLQGPLVIEEDLNRLKEIYNY